MEEYCGKRLARLNTCSRCGVFKNPVEIAFLCDLILLFYVLIFNFFVYMIVSVHMCLLTMFF